MHIEKNYKIEMKAQNMEPFDPILYFYFSFFFLLKREIKIQIKIDNKQKVK